MAIHRVRDTVCMECGQVVEEWNGRTGRWRCVHCHYEPPDHTIAFVMIGLAILAFLFYVGYSIGFLFGE